MPQGGRRISGGDRAGMWAEGCALGALLLLLLAATASAYALTWDVWYGRLGMSWPIGAYAPTPLYHGYANFVGFAPAFHIGACFASRRKFSASEFLPDVRRHGVTVFCYVGNDVCSVKERLCFSPLQQARRLA